MTTQKHETLQPKFSPRAEYLDAEFCAKAAGLLANGGTKSEAAEALGVTVSVASLAAFVHEQGRIAFRSQAELAKRVVAERDGNKRPWSIIGARAGGLTERRVQDLYEQAKGEPYVGSRLTRSGRQRTEPRKPATAPKAAVTEAELEGMTVKELQAFAEERGIEVPSKTNKAEMVALIVAGLINEGEAA